ncbi:hypothetical protein BDFB_013563, partial [Asbolus verrucosus]
SWTDIGRRPPGTAPSYTTNDHEEQLFRRLALRDDVHIIRSVGIDWIRATGHKHIDDYTALTPGVIAWGAICHGNPAPLVFIPGNLNSQRYIAVV